MEIYVCNLANNQVTELLTAVALTAAALTVVALVVVALAAVTLFTGVSSNSLLGCSFTGGVKVNTHIIIL